MPGISVLYGDANLGKSLGKPTLLSDIFLAARSQETSLQGSEELVIEHTHLFEPFCSFLFDFGLDVQEFTYCN